MPPIQQMSGRPGLTAAQSQAPPVQMQQQQQSFMSMWPPTQQQQAPRVSQAGFSMQMYNQQQAPCFSGKSHVTLADGTEIPVEELRKDMAVTTLKGRRTVVAVVKTKLELGGMDLCEIGIGGLVVTPWHPIKLASGLWKFPADAATPKRIACAAVSSILLQADSDADAHSVLIGGIWCVTLGHGVTTISERDARAHSFLGSWDKCYAAVESQLLNNPTGLVEAEGIRRSEKTGLLNGFLLK